MNKIQLREVLIMTSEQYQLLKEYGSWCRYFGCMGYHSTHQRKPYHIDDNTALSIDRRLVSIKQNQHDLYLIFKAHFINDVPYYRIKKYMKEKHPATALKLIGFSFPDIADLINKIGDVIFKNAIKSRSDI